MTPIRPIYGPHPDEQLVVDSIEDATAPGMLWGRRTGMASSPHRPQQVYLFQYAHDQKIVIAGITCSLKERARERGYGDLLWSRRLESRAACAKAERLFLQLTADHAVGPDLKSMTTWTEARSMSAENAIAAWERAIRMSRQNACTANQWNSLRCNESQR